MTGFESFVAKDGGSKNQMLGSRPQDCLVEGDVDLLHGDAVLRDVLESRLPHERDVAGIASLEPPREEGRDCIPAD